MSFFFFFGLSFVFVFKKKMKERVWLGRRRDGVRDREEGGWMRLGL